MSVCLESTLIFGFPIGCWEHSLRRYITLCLHCDFCVTVQFKNKHCWSFKRTKTLVCFHVPPLSQTVGNECISSSLRVVLRLWEQMSFWWNSCFVTRFSDVSAVPASARDTRVPHHLECTLNSRCLWFNSLSVAEKWQTFDSVLFQLRHIQGIPYDIVMPFKLNPNHLKWCF